MYYIGVDGGGTKTVYTLFNENKETLDEVKTPGSNHENMEGSFDEASEIIWSGLTALVAKRGITLDEMPIADYKGYSDVFAEDLYDEISLETCVAKRISAGSTGYDSVNYQIDYVKAQIGLN
jgi:argininosuccinate lyase